MLHSSLSQEFGEPPPSSFQFEQCIFKLLHELQYLMPEKLISFSFSRLFSHQYFTLLQSPSTKAFSSLGESSRFINSVENTCTVMDLG